ncbi:hypothetical protein [Saliphagus infecundisoli]|uniref:hypothetical protein n=1 Tax=Saliphagus infecundisoli TaxID=1849069 RepID=UPI001CD3357C|nr:hypothetical protein [Saliphagus infecundisoli]
MEPTEGGATPGETAVETAIQQYLDSVEAGNSRKNFQSTLATWKDWLRDERGVTTLEELEVIDCRRYARHLKQRPRAGDLKASIATSSYMDSSCPLRSPKTSVRGNSS